MIDVERSRARRGRGLLVAVCVAGCAVAMIGFGIAGRAASAHTADTQGEPSEANDTAVTIEIPEVDCAACNLRVRRSVKSAGGIRRLNEGTPKNRLVVTYEPGTGRPGVYVEALHEAGFAKAHLVQ